MIACESKVRMYTKYTSAIKIPHTYLSIRLYITFSITINVLKANN